MKLFGLKGEELFKRRLALETDVNTESVYHDMDAEAFEEEKKELEKLKKRCGSEYEAWKDKYISEEYEKLKDKKFIVCWYLFAGAGQYEDVMPEEMYPSFMCWIQGNGAAFGDKKRDATKEDIELYIAKHAADQ